MTGTIFLDDQELSVGETDGVVNVVIRRTGDLSGAVTVTYGITPDNATEGADYEVGYAGPSGTASIPAGADRVTVPVTILDDGFSEPSESFVFSVIAADSGTLAAPRTSRVFILDDENPVTDPVDPPLVSDYEVSTQTILTGLSQPLRFEFSPLDPEVIYVAQKPGIVELVNVTTGEVLGTVFDISGKVNNIQDRGLLDIALHPDLVNNPYLYAFYVVDPEGASGNSGNAGVDGGGNRYAHVVRFTLDAATGYTTVVSGSETVIVGGAGQSFADINGGGALDFTLTQHSGLAASDRYTDAGDVVIGGFKQDYIKVDSRSHAGGSLAFGPDGNLYISIGDGTSFNYADPRAVNVQNLDSLSGKILRVDPFTGQGLADNPFASGVSLDSNQAKVYQLGLRNPFSIAFDSNGRLFITETGWNTYEEINVGEPGANFGWPYYEGGDNGVNLQTSGYKDFASAQAFYQGVADGTITVTAAYRAFAHSSAAPGYQIQAITGGAVFYDSDVYPVELKNDFFFSDFSNGEIYAVDANDRRELKFLLDLPSFAPVHYAQGPDGYVYYADVIGGTIGRLLISAGPEVAVEAETLVLSNYVLEANGAASGGQLIRLPFAAEGGFAGQQGTATLQDFNGSAGLYEIGIVYFNESDGASAFEVLVNDVVVGSWVANAPSSSTSASAGNRVTHTLTNIALEPGDDIQIRGTRNGEEYARLDGITFNLTSAPVGDPVGIVADTDAAENSVAENAADGATVGITAQATDPDAGDTVAYSLDSGAGGRFAIDSASGVVTVANGSLLDFETADSYGIVVRATSSDGSFSTANYTISVTDVSEPIGPLADSNAAVNAVAENAADGATVGVTALATDPDLGSTVTYSLDDNAGGRFSVHPVTGVVTLADGSLLDTGSSASHNITVRATSADGSFSTETFTIAVIEGSPPMAVTVEAEDLILAGGYRLESKGVASGGALIRLSFDGAEGGFAGQQGTATFDFTGASGTYDLDVAYFNESDGASAFEILVNGVPVDSWTASAPSSSASVSAGNRVIHTTTGLTLNPGDDVVIRGTRDGEEYARVDTLTFTPVTPASDPIGPVSDTNAAANGVAENAANGTPVGITAEAADPDASDTVSYSLDDNAGGRFAIDGTTGVVTVANGSLLDYETATSHSIAVRATSSDGSFSTANFTVNVTDVNEAVLQTYVFEAESLVRSGYLLESRPAASGGQLIRLPFDGAEGGFQGQQGTATIQDFAGNAGTYDIQIAYFNENDGASTFEVLKNGVVVGSWVANAPSPSGGAYANTLFTQTLTGIALAPGDDIAIRGTRNAEEYARVDKIALVQTASAPASDPIGPVSDTNAAANGVAENAANGTPVGITAEATDPDAGDTVSYSLDDNAGGRFAIDGTTGVVTVANGSLLDYETATSHSIAVRATSSDGSFSTQAFNIAVSDADEPVGPVSDTNAAANGVAENAVNGTLVGITAEATDPDAGDTVSYSLDDNAGGRFAIDGTTGVVTVANGSLLDYETATSHSIAVRATSSDGSFSTQAFNIAVTNVAEGGTPTAFSVEAEDLILAGGYRLESKGVASGGALIRLSFDGAEGGFAGQQGTATFDFTGASGTYDLDVAYFNESDGASAFEILVNGVPVDSWTASAPSSSASVSAGNRVIHTTTGLTLNPGDDVVIRGTRDGEEYARVDTLTFTPVTPASDPIGPVSDTNAAANGVAENAANGTPVGITAEAADPDASDTVSYSLDDNAGGRFAIDGTTGVVTVANGSLLDYETATSHSIAVRATSSDGSFSTQAFNIAVSDVAEGGTPTTHVFEAESLTLSSTYRVESSGFASGGQLIRLPTDGAEGGFVGQQGTATIASFPGVAGSYDITVTYFNENDGASTFEIRVNGTPVGSWVADAPSDSGSVGANNKVTETIAGIALNPGDEVQLHTTRGGAELSRVDLVTFTPSGAFTPLSVSGLEVWLDGADSTSMTLSGPDVASWLDKSGNGHSYTQGTSGARPDLVAGLQNGLSGVRFDGVDDVLTANVDDLSLSGSTMFVVGKFNGADPGAGVLSFYNSAQPADSAQEDGLALFRGTSGNLSLARDSAGGDALSIANLAVGTDAAVATTTFAAGTGVLEVNGGTNAVDSYSNTNAMDPTASLLGARWQAGAVSPTLFGENDIYEVLVYDRALTSAEIDDIQSYLAGKWGISVGATDTDFQFIPFAGQSNAEHHFTDFGGAGSQQFVADFDALTDADSISVIDVATGGSSVDYVARPTWDQTRYWWNLETGTPGPQLTAAINAIKASGQTPTGIVWAQGEQDGDSIAGEGQFVGTTTIERYKQATEAVFGYFREQLDNPDLTFYIQQIGPHTSDVRQIGYSQIRQAQQELADTLDNVEIAAVTYDLALADNVHFTEAGYETAASRLARYIAFDQGYDGVTYGEGPSIASVSLQGGTQLTITLAHQGGTDVTPASGISGFWVEDSGSAVAITSAQRVSATEIGLTLASAISTSAVLHYINGLTDWDNANIVADNASPLALPLLPYDNVIV